MDFFVEKRERKREREREREREMVRTYSVFPDLFCLTLVLIFIALPSFLVFLEMLLCPPHGQLKVNAAVIRCRI